MSLLWNPLMERLGLRPSSRSHPPTTSPTLPLYSAVPSTSNPPSPALTTPPSEMGSTDDDLSPPTTSASPLRSTLVQLPTLPRFLADFTLGFADGLTVPFALTAGLSSLGQTDTVIYAGMAEICAGSISMGIGGYLAARGEVAAARAEASDRLVVGNGEEDEEEEGGLIAQEEKGLLRDEVEGYLEPLDLPVRLYEEVLRHVRGRPGVVEALRERERRKGEEAEGGEGLPSPFMAGFSVALGYLIGGVLPLFPYFLVSQVQDGLLWSFAVCAVALFVFGFAKDLALSSRPREANGRVRWSDVRRSVWEGAQMVILGSVAALAAVLCVRAFEGFRVDPSAQPS